MPTKKFKTVLITVFLQQTLEKELAAQTALLPAVLKRGNQGYPTFRDLRVRLEELYGAELSADVIKKGERQLISLSLELLNDKYAPGENLLRQGMALMKDVLTKPLLEDGAFKEIYVEQEKKQQEKEIRGLLNNKVNYALERCIQEMCAGERFGVYRYGDLEGLKSISAAGLYRYYCSLLKNNALDLFVVGEIDPGVVFPLVEEVFAMQRASRIKEIPPETVDIVPEEVRYKEERLPVNQGKLTFGYRTNVSYRDDGYVSMLFYNAVLGGYPHSKLFQNVREKASLAYYAFSRLEKYKGIQLIGSGIEVDNYEQAASIIQEQVEMVKKGEITREEMENTRMALISQLKIVGDSPYSMVAFSLDGVMGERKEGVEHFIEKIKAIRKEDVVEAAHKVYLDTIYFLRSENSKEGEQNSVLGNKGE